MRNKCYQEEYPIVSCVDFDTTLLVRRCTRYKLDESLPRRFQWFDLPLFNATNGQELSDVDDNWGYNDLNDFAV